MTKEEVIDKCLSLAEMDCFTKEQFEFRKFMYDVIDFLRSLDSTEEGEWIFDEDLSDYPNFIWFRCSNCHESSGVKWKFCPECGKRMKEGGENGESDNM